MSRYIYTLFAYADGNDFEDVADLIEARLRQFARSRRWIAGYPTIINRRCGKIQYARPDFIELWRLGLTLELTEIGTELPRWFPDVEAIARFLGTLHRDFGRSCYLGFADPEDKTEQLFEVSTNPSDVGKLPAIVGVRYIA